MDLAEGQGLFDSERKLQILIVGDTVGGLTLANLLQKRGYDPLVVRTDTDRSPSQLTTLWNVGVRVLQRVGINRQQRSKMVEVAGLYILSKTTSDQLKNIDADTEYPNPTVFSTAELRGTLHEQFGGNLTREKDVASLSDREDSVTVRFDDGVAESFDLVVNAGDLGLLESSFDTAPEVRNPSLSQIELPTPIDHDRRATLIEGWIDDVLVQQIPSPGTRESAVLRMTSPNDSIPVEAVVTRWRRQTCAKPINQSERTRRSREIAVDRTVAHGNTEDASRWADGRQVFLSPAAVGLTPASGFHIGFGIEDAWVLADEITHARGSAATVGNRFARRRRNRLATIRNRAIAANPIHAYPVRDTEPFETLTAFRSVCLGAFCATELAELQELSGFGS